MSNGEEGPVLHAKDASKAPDWEDAKDAVTSVATGTGSALKQGGACFLVLAAVVAVTYIIAAAYTQASGARRLDLAPRRFTADASASANALSH